MKQARKHIEANSSQCKWDNCNELNTSNSKYCLEHKAQAKQRWLETISKGKEEKEKRLAIYKAAFAEAAKKAKEAGSSHTPTPMVVVEHENPLDDESPVKKVYEPVGDGICGFAWVVISPGTSSLAKYAKKYQGYYNYYHGGVYLRVSKYGQSYERKSEYAKTYAETLEKELGDRKSVV